MSGTITIPNYGNATERKCHSCRYRPQKTAVNPRVLLPAPTTIAETGVPEELLVQLLVRTLVHSRRDDRADCRGHHEVAVWGHEGIIYAYSKREIL